MSTEEMAVELCKKAVPTGEETGSKKARRGQKHEATATNKAKARAFTVPELQRTVEQLNAKLAESSAPQVELPKVKSKVLNLLGGSTRKVRGRPGSPTTRAALLANQQMVLQQQRRMPVTARLRVRMCGLFILREHFNSWRSQSTSPVSSRCATPRPSVHRQHTTS